MIPFIDTLNYFVEEGHFRLRQNADLQVIPQSYNLRDREDTREKTIIYYDNNFQMTGSKAFHNSEDGIIGLTVKNCKLFVRTNIPRLHSGNDNFTGVTKDEFRPVLQKTVNYAKAIGIEFDLNNIKAGRLDLCRNINLDYDFLNYNRCFKFMRMKYSRRKADFENGYLTGSKSRQIACYDKGLDMKSKYGIDLGREVMRAEFRAMNGKQVKKVFTDNTLECLLDQWDSIKDLYIQEMKDLIFRGKSGVKPEGETPDYVQVLKELRKKHKRNAGFIFIGMFGFSDLMSDFTESELKTILEKGGFKRTQVWQLMRDMKDGLEIGVRTKKLSTVGLYNELRDKILEIA